MRPSKPSLAVLLGCAITATSVRAIAEDDAGTNEKRFRVDPSIGMQGNVAFYDMPIVGSSFGAELTLHFPEGIFEPSVGLTLGVLNGGTVGSTTFDGVALAGLELCPVGVRTNAPFDSAPLRFSLCGTATVGRFQRLDGGTWGTFGGRAHVRRSFEIGDATWFFFDVGFGIQRSTMGVLYFVSAGGAGDGRSRVTAPDLAFTMGVSFQ